MKKINKIIVMVLMVALSIGSFFISPISGLVAATATVGTAFTLTKVPTTGTVREAIKIPKGKTDGGNYVSISVVDPAGQEVSNTLEDKGEYYELTPKMVGDYKVQYTSNGDVDVVSNEYIITVTGVKPTLSFESNLQEIVPAKLNYKNSEGQVNKITLPSPSKTENADDEDSTMETLGRIKKSEAPSTLINHEMPLEDAKAYIGYNVSVRDSKYQAVTNIDYVLKEITVDGEDYYEIHYTVSPVENVYGTYRITYTYQSLTTGLTASKSMTFEVKKNYEEKTELSYKFKDGASMPKTASVGEEVTLPTPAVTDVSGSTVSVYTDVEVYFVDAGKTSDESKWIKIPVNNFKFTTSYKATNGAYYLVKYTIKDFFGNTVDTVKTQWNIENVTDKTSPKLYVVKDYSSEDAVADIENTAEDMFPTYAEKGQSITLPAIYAEDNISKVLNVEDSEKEITLTRRVVFNGTSSSFSASSLIKAKDDATTFANSNEVLFTPDKAGEYVIYYEATDKAGNSATSIKKTITVVDSYEDEIAPTITLPKVANVAYTGDTVTFSAPSAIDYGMIDNEKKIVESEVDVSVYYYFVYENDLNNKSKENKTALIKNEDGTYSIAIPTNEQVKKVVIVLEATDNAKYSHNKNENNIEEKEIVINVQDVQNDVTAPTLVTSEFEDETFAQIDKKTIQNVTFSDENSVNISVKVDYLGSERTSDSVFTGTVNKNDNNYTLSGASFNTTKVGSHIVTFTATDVNGNARIVAYKVEVSRSDKFGFTVDADANPSKVEVGEEVTLNAGVLYNTIDEEIYDNATVGIRLLSVDVSDTPAEVEYNGGYKIKALSEGLIKYQYYAIYEGKEIQIENNPILTIEAKDTTKPTIEFYDGADEWSGSTDKTVESALEYEYDESATGNYVLVEGEYVEYNATEHQGQTRYSRGYADIEIPAVYVKDANGISEESVKITTPSNKTIEFINKKDMKIAGGDVVSKLGYKYFYTFAPTGNGPYTIEYSATDLAGNTTTVTYKLQVGDCEEPTLDIKNAQSIESAAKVGDVLKIDLNVMELTDNVDETISAENALTNGDGLKLTITITTPDNQTITLSKSDSYYSRDEKAFNYTLSSAGEYTVKYTLTDSAKLTHEITRKITVNADSSSNITSDAVWGTLLVVASVVLLGGVIVYFTVTNKKYTSKKKEDK